MLMIGQRSSHHQLSSHTWPGLATIGPDAFSYCTARCLRSIVEDCPDLADPHCPSAVLHGADHISKAVFLNELQSKLDAQELRRACIEPLGLAGYHGALFKVRLPTSAHCLVAKGFVAGNAELAEHEAAVYARLQDLQGQDIPLCCGRIALNHPLPKPGSDEPVVQLLLLSYGGEPILKRYPEGVPIPSRFEAPLLAILEKLHQRQVVHGDPELKNVLLDAQTNQVVLVDFERSRLYEERPPCEDHKRCLKTRKDRKGRRKNCMYCREFEVVRSSLADPDYLP